MHIIPVGQRPIPEVNNELIGIQLASHLIVLIVQAIDERPGQKGNERVRRALYKTPGRM